ncbi:MAG: hypothetical protein AABW46_03580 [Nanoarchaeota archaeon]
MKLRVVILSLLIILIIMPASLALKGVGIKWSSESAIVEEESTTCLDYGLYNPWDEAINAELGVSEELQEVITVKESETVFLNAFKPSSDAVPVQLCFKVPEVYEDDCLIAGFLCEQTCDLGEISFKGDVVATGKGTDVSGSSGSSATVAASVPLELIVNCEERERSYVDLYIAILILVLIIIGVVFYKRKSNY